MARAAKAAVAAPAKAKKPFHNPEGWNITIRPDGELNHPDLEHLAQLMADGFEPAESWTAIGKRSTGSAGVKRRFAQNDATFILRVERLKRERTELETQDPIWGPVSWQAQQLWRAARMANDIKLLAAAAELSFKVAKERAGAGDREKVAETEADEAKNPVGRPVKENPQARRDPTLIRAHLLNYGAKTDEIVPNSAENDED